MDSAVSSASPASECVGLTIDARFPLLRWLGGTEHSSVFLTQIEATPPRRGALKLVSGRATDTEHLLAQWAAAAKLSHPHLLRIFHVGHCDIDGEDYLYVVTECADEILSDLLASRALTPEEATEMLNPVLDALSWLHARGLVHGHLQPSNIMVIDESVKLSVDGFRTVGQSKQSGGYDAPEVAAAQISPAVDIWSLGVVLTEALTLRPPVWNAARTAQPAVPIPEPFSTLVRGCLQIDPARRPTLSELRAFLQPATGVASEPLAGDAPRSINAIRQQLIDAAHDEVEPPTRRTPALPAKRKMILTGAVVVLGGVIGAVVLASHHTQPSPPAAEQSSAPQPSAQQPPAPQVSAPQTPAPQASAPAPAASQPAPPKAAVVPPAAPQTPKPSAPAASSAQSPAPESPSPQPPTPQAAPPTGSVVRGTVAFRTTPDVPQHILDTIQGHVRVRVRVQVDPNGQITDAALDDPGPSHYFSAKALAAARNWKFTPAQSDGHAVASTWMLHFSFGPTDTTVTPLETAP